MPKPDRKPNPDFEPDYDMADPDYDEGAQAEYGEGGDAEVEDAAQPDYEAEFSDPDSEKASQEYYKRSQK